MAVIVEATAPEHVGAGAEEDPGFQLDKKELLFRQCLRSRLERAARKRKEAQERKEAEERKRREVLDAAFEDEVEVLLAFLRDGGDIDTADLYGGTLLSEAAAGGAEECVDVLLGHGADPNSTGRNKRTPLWRAANAGYAIVVQALLRGGADPRTPDDSGVLPYNVANGAEVKMLLECWDVSVTESMRKSLNIIRAQKESDKKEKERKQIAELQDALEETERRAYVAKCEIARVQKLVVEYRHQQASFAERGEVNQMRELDPLKENAEVQLENAKRIHQDLEWQVKRAKLKLRDFENKLRRKNKKPGEVIVKPDQIIQLRDLADVVTHDVGGKLQEDGRWPLVFDPSGKSVTFFRYSGAAFFDAAELAVLSFSEDIDEQQRFLLAILRHLKYGGQVVVNCGDDFGQMKAVETSFNDIEPGLFNTFTDRSVRYSYLFPRRFLSLVPCDFKEEYSEYMFDDALLSKFVLTFVVTSVEPPMEVMERECHAFHIIKVRDPETELELEADVED